jgi:hypothetical protein
MKYQSFLVLKLELKCLALEIFSIHVGNERIKFVVQSVTSCRRNENLAAKFQFTSVPTHLCERTF